MNEEHPQMDEAEMRIALRALRGDIEPEHDLWPGIAARLQAVPQQSGQTARTSRSSRPSRWWPFAMAASVLLAVGVVWQIKPVKPDAVVPQIARASPAIEGETLMQREADNMTVHYQSALREMERVPLPAGWQPGFDALDRSAIEIRAAMEHDPNSRLLLERLRTTYTRRLVLARRALYV